MTTWPAELPPRPLVDGFAETPAELAVRSPMEVGPAKVRRRATAGVTKLECRFRLTPTQRASLLAFWQTTLKGGVLRFDWTHPVTDAPISCRIIAPPAFTPIAGGVAWQAALSLEVLP
jgi:hypothetical protein